MGKSGNKLGITSNKTGKTSNIIPKAFLLK